MRPEELADLAHLRPSAPPGQDVDVVLSPPHGGRSQVEGHTLLRPVTQGSLQAAILRADDLDATFVSLQASEAEVLEEPTSPSWGARDCAPRPVGPRSHRAGLSPSALARRPRRAL